MPPLIAILPPWRWIAPPLCAVWVEELTKARSSMRMSSPAIEIRPAVPVEPKRALLETTLIAVIRTFLPEMSISPAGSAPKVAVETSELKMVTSPP